MMRSVGQQMEVSSMFLQIIQLFRWSMDGVGEIVQRNSSVESVMSKYTVL